jgi:hypothetical protein
LCGSLPPAISAHGSDTRTGPAAGSIGDVLRAGEENPGAALEAGEHPGDLSTVTMTGATSDHIVGDGHGSDSWTGIIDSVRGPR